MTKIALRYIIAIMGAGWLTFGLVCLAAMATT